MRMHAKAMVMASLLADSLALGAHWIYDTHQIDREIGRVDRLLPPLPGSYHKDKKRGDFTHYGDQVLVLLESIARNNEFILQGFSRDWQHLFSSYTGYVDRATEQTMNNFAAGAPPEKSGSDSDDLGGPARLAPLIFCYRDDLKTLLSLAEQQTKMTHTAPAALAAADFLARVTFAVLHGAHPADAIQTTLDQNVSGINLKMKLKASLASTGENSRQVIAHLGQMCGAGDALPSAIHLITSYPENLETALIENTMAGGDSAARGLVVGMVLGAHLGMEKIPEKWLKELRKKEHITALLSQIP